MGIDVGDGCGGYDYKIEPDLNRLLLEATSLMPLVSLKKCSQELRDWIAAQTKNDPALIKAEIERKNALLEQMTNDSWRVKKEVNKLHRDLERVQALNKKKR